ncbi:MAG: transglutaminase family protein [Gammaproteobacteria bacterium]|nr:MAG: transglutaminase family protein [Gammaproteobacteria bacterium]RLA56490.1 MAG: transglutaminase family protein [Gammaproteobacteria bacterium]HDY82649.1 transglutaminase family protein [Halieaceae bacterium]
MSIDHTLEDYLQPSQCINSDHPKIVELAQSLIDSGKSDQENAVTLYYWVRDKIRYNPYEFSTTVEAFLASTTLQTGESWCVPKSILLAALCRSVGIPARLGFADVRNHLSTERLRATMNSDVFYFHGYTSIYLNKRWVKATPAFNIELCEKFGLHPLEFDGTQDSLYHEFDVAGNKHMEYINDRGEHLDLPFDELFAVLKEHYPGMFLDMTQNLDALPDSASWDADVAREVALP